MTIITAKIIEDSIAESNGVRLTTLQLQYPRFIHAEFMTHRVFSRNASSSRAIPVAKVIEQVRDNPAMPIHWGKNQPGMQANDELDHRGQGVAVALWRKAAQEATTVAKYMNELGLHKQVVNRILEPFQYMHVIVTATEWQNFFELRAHPDAQPEIHALAIEMSKAMNASQPKALKEGHWHMPYVLPIERVRFSDDTDLLLKLSAARCARVSYLTHDGKEPSVEKDLELYDRLVGSRPLHASPIEHQATPMGEEGRDLWSGNFRGWLQHRQIIESTI